MRPTELLKQVPCMLKAVENEKLEIKRIFFFQHSQKFLWPIEKLGISWALWQVGNVSPYLFSYSSACVCTAWCLLRWRSLGFCYCQGGFRRPCSVSLTVKLVSDQKSKKRILKQIHSYYVPHLNMFITNVSTGDRSQSLTTVELVIGQKTFWVSKQEEFSRAGLAIGLKAVTGSGVEMEFLKAENKKVKSPGQECAWLETTVRIFCLWNCNGSVGHKINFALSQDKEIFFVRSKGVRKNKMEVDHVSVVDTGKRIV